MPESDDPRTVRMTIEDGVAELVLDRPDKMNAMSIAMVRELIASLDAAESGGARALLVRGEGRAFCSGRDLSEADPLHEDGEAILRDLVNPLMTRMAGHAMPTIAAVHGACLGTGLGLALACDVMYAADDARIGSPFARIGAVLDSGAHAALVSRIGPHRTLELVYTGRLLSGREAAEWGLVNRSVAGADLVRRTREMARTIARGPTAAFLESKRLVRLIADSSPSPVELLAAEAAAQGRASRTHDYQDGITAFLEKRKPSFTGR
ncbi:MAG: enoyl-CoA hydratase/isomerase family protein [Candidatus Dormiibacterota bacterium]